VSSEDTTSDGSESSGQEYSGDPARYRYLFENVQDAVVDFEIVDETPVVRDVNQAFVSVFGYDREQLLGESLNEFIVPDALTAESATFDDRTEAGEHNKAVVRRETASGIRRFLYRSVPYEDSRETARGFAIYSDITDETRREHRLQVMHRILRHNLRNDVNVIDTSAEWLAAELEEESLLTVVEWIRQSASSLEHLSVGAGRVRRVLDNPQTDEHIEVGPLLEEVRTGYQEAYPAADIEVAAPSSLEVTASPHLRLALTELVENAIEHNDSADPRVRLTATVPGQTDNEWVELSVADDGPRIPESERVVTATDREPTQVEHGTGLGLLLVQWIVDSIGGTVSIEEGDLGGNCVRLRLKRAET